MRSPAVNSPPQVHRSLAAGALTPHEAAARLTRLEFDVARLERELATAHRRSERARQALARHNEDRQALLKIIANGSAYSKKLGT